MRRTALPLATAVLLLGPTALAFFAGGYFDGARAVAGAAAWALVFGLALLGPLPFPASRSGRVAVAALAGIAVWTAVSFAWAPLSNPARARAPDAARRGRRREPAPKRQGPR